MLTEAPWLGHVAPALRSPSAAARLPAAPGPGARRHEAHAHRRHPMCGSQALPSQRSTAAAPRTAMASASSARPQTPTQPSRHAAVQCPARARAARCTVAAPWSHAPCCVRSSSHPQHAGPHPASCTAGCQGAGPAPTSVGPDPGVCAGEAAPQGPMHGWSPLVLGAVRLVRAGVGPRGDRSRAPGTGTPGGMGGWDVRRHTRLVSRSGRCPQLPAAVALEGQALCGAARPLPAGAVGRLRRLAARGATRADAVLRRWVPDHRGGGVVGVGGRERAQDGGRVQARCDCVCVTRQGRTPVSDRQRGGCEKGRVRLLSCR